MIALCDVAVGLQKLLCMFVVIIETSRTVKRLMGNCWTLGRETPLPISFTKKKLSISREGKLKLKTRFLPKASDMLHAALVPT